jgi:hypothetical protein
MPAGAIPSHDAQLSDLRPYIATVLRSTVPVSSDEPHAVARAEAIGLICGS